MLATRNLVSIGKLARSLNVTVDELDELARGLKVVPLQTIDGVAFFDAADEARFSMALARKSRTRQVARNRLVVILRGGPFNGKKFEREPPAIGTVVEVFLNMKPAPNRWGQSHHYRATYQGGRLLTLKCQGVLPKALDPFHQIEAGEG